MLRIGLTGDLGSGKSTVARMLAERGAVVLSSDEIGRALMQPGEAVYAEIVAAFGEAIVAAGGQIDRRRLARLAFDPVAPRVEELNAIVHPAVLAAQAKEFEEIGRTRPDTIAVVESALIFSTLETTGVHWSRRFDCIVLVEAPESVKIARFVERVAAGRPMSAEAVAATEADARQRLAVQHATAYAADCMVVHNDGDVEQLEAQVDAVWQQLKQFEAEGKG
ncbi:MAG: dephospho-CoA kinase [Acidobacteria bacterium]|nr:dephospho-CoA kinase [Acidobacteriota bacterium]